MEGVPGQWAFTNVQKTLEGGGESLLQCYYLILLLLLLLPPLLWYCMCEQRCCTATGYTALPTEPGIGGGSPACPRPCAVKEDTFNPKLQCSAVYSRYRAAT